ncbi:S-layer protein [filamentous cyanobacterium CCP2]|nr:S-layer protein [filamentous cyanobacterium CCP2]
MVPRKFSLFTGFAVCLVLASCTNSPWAQNLERSLEADPTLENSSVFGDGSEADATSPETRPIPGPNEVQLPANFPGEIPFYPNAELIAATRPSPTSPDLASSGRAVTQTRWRTPDSQEEVEQFYRSQFEEAGWQIIEPSNSASLASQPVVAEQDGLQVAVAVAPSRNNAQGADNAASDAGDVGDATEFTIHYQFTDRPPVTQSPEASPSPSQTASSSSQAFADIDQAPPELQPYITDLQALGALSVAADGSDFAPNQTITRREYARWLVQANNLIYANQPSRKIRLGVSSDQPAFQDVPTTDPDFDAIQGLANAGLIPSPLSGNATEVTFRPDAPLTREDLILWKAPIDSRQALPNASIDAVQQTWGFQDTARISPEALRAVLADFQNGDLSNIRRAFGYTTLFQPQKPVTRAEAAAALWFFGSQGNGLSAKDALPTNRQAAGD